MMLLHWQTSKGAALRNIRLIILARALRTCGYGATSVVMGVMLADAGMSTVQIGVLLAVAALGSITFCLFMGIYADRLGRKRLLIGSALCMMSTGCIFALTRSYPLLLLASFCGTISPSTNDNTPFSGVEQAILAQSVETSQHASVFAAYNLVAQLAGALGGLLASVPGILYMWRVSMDAGIHALFLLYALLAGITALLFLWLSPEAELSQTESACTLEAGMRKKVNSQVFKLSALFALDAFAGGLAVQAILAIWFHRRFGASLEALGCLFFAVNLLAALSLLSAKPLSGRFGLLKTMLIPHCMSNVFLLLVGLMPSFPLAALCLLLRQALSKIDVPARQAFTAALVTPEERTAAASFTTVARSIAVSASPLVAGVLLTGPLVGLGIPILSASCLELGYDAAMWRIFRHVPSGKQPQQDVQRERVPVSEAPLLCNMPENSSALLFFHPQESEEVSTIQFIADEVVS